MLFRSSFFLRCVVGVAGGLGTSLVMRDRSARCFRGPFVLHSLLDMSGRGRWSRAFAGHVGSDSAMFPGALLFVFVARYEWASPALATLHLPRGIGARADAVAPCLSFCDVLWAWPAVSGLRWLSGIGARDVSGPLCFAFVARYEWASPALSVLHLPRGIEAR